MRNVREPLGLVNREVSDVLNLCLPSYGHSKQSLCQLVGHIADQQEQLVDAVQCRADRVGVQQVADSCLCPVGQLCFLVPSQDADRLSTVKSWGPRKRRSFATGSMDLTLLRNENGPRSPKSGYVKSTRKKWLLLMASKY
jgi:hypothetical protein